jgi:hypothetical protein
LPDCGLLRSLIEEEDETLMTARVDTYAWLAADRMEALQSSLAETAAEIKLQRQLLADRTEQAAEWVKRDTQRKAELTEKDETIAELTNLSDLRLRCVEEMKGVVEAAHADTKEALALVAELRARCERLECLLMVAKNLWVPADNRLHADIDAAIAAQHAQRKEEAIGADPGIEVGGTTHRRVEEVT